MRSKRRTVFWRRNIVTAIVPDESTESIILTTLGICAEVEYINRARTSHRVKYINCALNLYRMIKLEVQRPHKVIEPEETTTVWRNEEEPSEYEDSCIRWAETQLSCRYCAYMHGKYDGLPHRHPMLMPRLRGRCLKPICGCVSVLRSLQRKSS